MRHKLGAVLLGFALTVTAGVEATAQEEGTDPPPSWVIEPPHLVPPGTEAVELPDRPHVGRLPETAMAARSRGDVSEMYVSARPADNEPCSAEGACQGRGDCYEAESPCEDNDLSPSFQDSPVDHSFNPVICLPASTCNFDGGKQEAAFPPDTPPLCPPMGVPPAAPHCDPKPHSLFPPSPEKLVEGVQAMFDAGIKLGTTIAQLVVDYVVTVFRFIV